MPPGAIQLLVRIAQSVQEIGLPRVPLIVPGLHVPVGVEPLENAADVPLRPRHLAIVNFYILSHDDDASIIRQWRWHPEAQLVEVRNMAWF